MKKNAVYVAFCLLMLASDSARAARFFWPWSSSTQRALARYDDGRKIYEAAFGKPMGDVSPRKAAGFLKDHLWQITPELAQEVKDIIKAIGSGKTIPPTHLRYS